MDSFKNYIPKILNERVCPSPECETHDEHRSKLPFKYLRASTCKSKDHIVVHPNRDSQRSNRSSKWKTNKIDPPTIVIRPP